MRVGHSSPSFCHDAAADTLRACAKAGFDVWEIVGDGRHSLPEAVEEIQAAQASWPIGLQLHAPIADVNLGSLNPKAWTLSVETVEGALTAASKLDIRRVTIHPGNHSPLSRGHYAKVHESTRAALRRLDALGVDLGLELNLENMPLSWAFETTAPEQLADLVDGTSFAYTFDFGHAHVAKQLDSWEQEVPRIRNVHIHDNRGQTDEHLTLDEGNLPWKRVAAALRSGGYDGTWVIESRSHASGAQSLERLRQWGATA